MQTFKNVKGYANRKNAIKKLEKELDNLGITTNDVSWFIIALENGRFAPVVKVGAQVELLSLPHSGVCII